jgi:hypothetical protein
VRHHDNILSIHEKKLAPISFFHNSTKIEYEKKNGLYQQNYMKCRYKKRIKEKKYRIKIITLSQMKKKINDQFNI